MDRAFGMISRVFHAFDNTSFESLICVGKFLDAFVGGILDRGKALGTCRACSSSRVLFTVTVSLIFGVTSLMLGCRSTRLGLIMAIVALGRAHRSNARP